MRIKFTFLFISGLALGLQCFGQEQEKSQAIEFREPVAWGLSADINSKYLWRGVSVNEGLVLQPDIYASYRNLTAGMWSNLTLYDRHNITREREFDFYLEYSLTLGKLEIAPSFMLFWYPGEEDSPTTGELYLSLSYPLGDISLTTVIAADLIAYLGSLYFEHGISYQKALGRHFSVASSAVLGWGNARFNDAYIASIPTSLNLLSLNAELTYMPTGSWYLKPHIQVSKALNQEISSSIGKFPWYFGVMVGIDL